MARTRRTAHTRIAPQRVVDELRAAMPWVVARIASAIQAEVPALAGPLRGGRRRLIEDAVRAGLKELADRAAGKARPDADADELFRRLGHAEALDGATLDAVRAACGIAIRDVWDELHRIALAEGLPTWVLGRLGDALFEQAAHLLDEVEAGHRAGDVGSRDDVRRAGEGLARSLLRGEQVDPADPMVRRAGWQVPERLLVLAVRSADLDPAIDVADALVVADSDRVIVLCDERIGHAVAERLAASATVAVSLAVWVSQAGCAASMAERALDLVDAGQIPASGVVDCADHEMVLWLHAEPVLRDRLAARLLSPLDSVTPHRRRVLATTLLVRLERRASAPVIAARLGVHPQTVRQRLRVLDGLFGEQLDDPDTAFAVLMALKATVTSQGELR